jgi:tRNA-dihydrouridine synthase
MSVDLEPSHLPSNAATRPIAEIARGLTVDPRVATIVAGFDAPFFQAGLAGYSDGAMRIIARRHGCPYTVTEALLDRTIINGGKGRTREDPDLLARTHQRDAPAPEPDESCALGDPWENRIATLEDHPIAGQIMGTLPGEMAQAAAMLVAMNYDVIDVNLACPVKKVRRANRGGHLLSSPDEAIAILRAVRTAVPRGVPCTVKLRRAYDDTPAMALNFERTFHAAYELGYAWATVHCRTVQQKYNGPGKWPFLIDLVKRNPDKIIFGSGDVWTVDDIFAMLDVTGVHAVAVARGCIGNPWIFRQARQLIAGGAPAPPTLAEQRQVLLDHFDLAMTLHGEHVAGRMMRKFGIKFAAHHPRTDDVKNQFIRCKSLADWRDVIKKHYEREDSPRSEPARPRAAAPSFAYGAM